MVNGVIDADPDSHSGCDYGNCDLGNFALDRNRLGDYRP